MSARIAISVALLVGCSSPDHPAAAAVATDATPTTITPAAEPDAGPRSPLGDAVGFEVETAEDPCTRPIDPSALTTIATAADLRFGAVTPDGSSIAWLTVAGGVATVYVADAPFTTSTGVASGIAPAGAALSPDGLRLVTVASNGRFLEERARSRRSEPFGPPSTTSFARIDALVGDGPATLSHPSLAGDALYVTVGSTVRRALRTGDVWSSGDPIDALGAAALTSISSDETRAFVASAESAALFARDSSAAPFASKTVVLGRKRVGATEGCSILFWSSTTDLVMEK